MAAEVTEQIKPEAKRVLLRLHPWHRILMTQPIMYNALGKAAANDARVALNLKKAFTIAYKIRQADPNIPLKPIIDSIAAIHASLGPVKTADFLRKALHQMRSTHEAEKTRRVSNALPNELLDLQGVSPSKKAQTITNLLTKARQQRSEAMKLAMQLQSGALHLTHVQHMLTTNQQLSKATGLDEAEVSKKLFSLYDKAHRILGTSEPIHLTSAFSALASRSIKNQRSFNRTLDLFDDAIDKVDKLRTKRGGRPTVIRDVAYEISDLAKTRRGALPFEEVEAIVNKHIILYRTSGEKHG